MKNYRRKIIPKVFRLGGAVLFLLSLGLFLSMCSLFQTQSKQVEVREDTLTIPTYGIKESPYPPFPTTYWTNDVYPYTLLDSPSLNKKEKEYKLLVLENDYLKITVLPEVGGHVYNFYDKVNDREAVYVNRVMKFLTYGLRWGWPAGGMEFNFPHAHSVTTLDSIDYSIQDSSDGSGSIVIGNVENVYGMRWQVTLTLHPNQSCLRQKVRMHNRTPLPHRYHFWTITAFPVNEKTQVIFPARRMIDHKQEYIRTYPRWGGVDISWALNPFAGGSWSALQPYGDFWCVYHHKEDAGMVHVANRNIVPGSKWFGRGASTQSQYRGAAMSDGDGNYIETDGGSDLTQIDFRRFKPLGTHHYQEYWYPVHGLPGKVVKANPKACLSLETQPSQLGLAVNRPLKKGRVEVMVKEKKVLEKSISLNPLKSVSIPVELKKGPLKVVLFDSSGKNLLTYESPRIEEKELPPEGPVRKQEKALSEMSAEEAYLKGIDEITHPEEHFLKGEEYFQRAVELDPGHSLARRELGILYLKRGLWDKAEKEFQKSLKRNPHQGEAHYYRGWVNKIKGESEEALNSLFEAAKYSETEAPAFLLLGKMMMVRHRWRKAQEYLKRAYSQSRSTEAQVLLASVFRKKSQFKKARQAVSGVLAEEPINYFASYEKYLVDVKEGKKSDRLFQDFIHSIGDKEHAFLHLACFYIQSGQYQEAVDLLEKKVQGEETKSMNPLFYFYLGDLYDRLGNQEESLRYFKSISHLSLDPYVFPRRLPEFFILRKAQKSLPDHFFPHFALGNLLAGRYRFSEAVAQYKKALKKLSLLSEKERKSHPELMSVVHRNIGVLLWKTMNRPDQALPYYKKAVRHATWHFKPFEELSEIYREMGNLEKAVRTARSGLDRVELPYKLVLTLIPLYTKLEEYDKILNLLTQYPADDHTKTKFQDRWKEIHVKKGKNLLREGNYEESIRWFEQAAAIPPELFIPRNKIKPRSDFALAWWWKGVALEKMGNEGQARECWEKAAQTRYDALSRGQLYKAKSLVQLGKKDQASRLLHQIIHAAQTGARVITEGAAPPWEAYLFFLQGAAYEELGFIDKAINFYKKALKVDPAHTEPVYTDTQKRLEELKR